jgi:hypothetical protein
MDRDKSVSPFAPRTKDQMQTRRRSCKAASRLVPARGTGRGMTYEQVQAFVEWAHGTEMGAWAHGVKNQLLAHEHITSCTSDLLPPPQGYDPLSPAELIADPQAEPPGWSS